MGSVKMGFDPYPDGTIKKQMGEIRAIISEFQTQTWFTDFMKLLCDNVSRNNKIARHGLFRYVSMTSDFWKWTATQCTCQPFKTPDLFLQPSRFVACDPQFVPRYSPLCWYSRTRGQLYSHIFTTKRQYLSNTIPFFQWTVPICQIMSNPSTMKKFRSTCKQHIAIKLTNNNQEQIQ